MNSIPRIDDSIGKPIRNGLTLLELLMVLVILAIVSTVALSSLQPRVQQQRFDTSRNLLEQIKLAVIGPVGRYQLDQTPLISGFVADVGRLPAEELLTSESQLALDPLRELWDDQSELAKNFPFMLRTGPKQPVDFSDVSIPCGWRAPYIQLAPGENSVRDPWGKFLNIRQKADGSVSELVIELPDSEITDVEPQPADPGTDQENRPALVSSLESGLVTVSGRVLYDQAVNPEVYLLLPDPEKSLTMLSFRRDEDEVSSTFTFSNVPIGLRAIVVVNQGQKHTKYIQVTHQGSDVTFDLRSPQN